MAHSAIIHVMSEAAIKASKGLIRDFGEIDQLQISKKGTSNFVTNADVRTEKFLQQELKKSRPDFGFLLEEGGNIPGKDKSHRWIIDPLDGTSNFIHAVPYFCISIGLEKIYPEGHSEIIAGVIYDPIHNELFAAEKGKGATMNGRRIVVSQRAEMEDALLVLGNPKLSAKENKDTFRLLDTLLQSKATLRHFGATALDLAYIAAGRLDACWYYSIQPWDIAAGMLLVQEAGGIVSNFEGEPIDTHSGSLLASNRDLNLPLRALLSKAA
jgi:myo-inositol-1(or 4)-monophosphatase